MKIVRLKFTTPLHISNVRSDYSISETLIHSDTLYSAIISALSNLGYDKYLNSLLEQNNISFTVSSLFPYIYLDGKYHYYLPKPLTFQLFKSKELSEVQKDFKKVEFVDAELFKMIQEGNEIIPKQDGYISGIFISKNSSEIKIYEKVEQPRVRVPRDAGDSQPFYIERIFFRDNAGLYFFLQCENEKSEHAVVAALTYLGMEGIGTDRNVGNGKFNFEIVEDVHIIHFNNLNTDYSVNLSLYIPSSHNEFVDSLDDNCYFSIVTRGGWITSYPYLTLRKKSVRAIKEGSNLKLQPGIHGRIVDVSPNTTVLPQNYKNIHRIFRIGKALWVPIKIRKN